MSITKIVPLILSGGAGSRLWPVSTDERPKQFHTLVGDKSMFLTTLERVQSGADIEFGAPMIVCGAKHNDVTASELASANITNATLVLEPMPRNTAAALAAACLIQAQTDPDALILVLPADHIITKPEALRAACCLASSSAQSGKIVTFAIVPTSAETGYGYIKRGAPLGDGVYEVEAFKEKPDAVTAQHYLDVGEYSWNAGIFLFSATALLHEMGLHAPQILAATKEAVETCTNQGNTFSLDPVAFAKVPSTSIDYAVMEPTSQAAVVPVDMGWSDVGSFSTLWELGTKDASGNVALGSVLLHDAAGCLVHSEGPPVAVIGLNDIMIISTPEGILVAPRGRAQDVKLASQAFKRA
jgi:mannose-1-phosphate guanylyltransferase / mannose-6-phosphate isomerase